MLYQLWLHDNRRFYSSHCHDNRCFLTIVAVPATVATTGNHRCHDNPLLWQPSAMTTAIFEQVTCIFWTTKWSKLERSLWQLRHKANIWTVANNAKQIKLQGSNGIRTYRLVKFTDFVVAFGNFVDRSTEVLLIDPPDQQKLTSKCNELINWCFANPK